MSVVLFLGRISFLLRRYVVYFRQRDPAVMLKLTLECLH